MSKSKSTGKKKRLAKARRWVGFTRGVPAFVWLKTNRSVRYSTKMRHWQRSQSKLKR